MIESGTLVPGIGAADFGLPSQLALRWERPAEAVRPYLSSYAVYDSELADGQEIVGSMLPSWARIGVGIARAPVSFAVCSRASHPLPTAALMGVTSRAVPLRASGGVTVAIDVGPLGWARLFAGSAEAYRDRLVPLDAVMDPRVVGDLAQALARSDRGREVKPLLDAFVAPLLRAPHRDEAAIARLWALVADARTTDLAAAAATQGITPTTMRRLAKRYFAFPPKVLLNRTRFVRALLPMLEAGADRAGEPQGYYDRSHFRRDARRFLGMAPGRYVAQPMPFIVASLRARRLVIGSPLPLLDPVPGDDTVRAG